MRTSVGPQAAKVAAKEPQMSIFVRIFHSKATQVVSLSQNSSVAELKRCLTVLFGQRNTQMSTYMRLIHQGKVLSENETTQLRQAGIKNGSFIQVEHAGALKGGSDGRKRIWTTGSDEMTPRVDTSIKGKSEFN